MRCETLGALLDGTLTVRGGRCGCRVSRSTFQVVSLETGLMEAREEG